MNRKSIFVICLLVGLVLGCSSTPFVAVHMGELNEEIELGYGKAIHFSGAALTVIFEGTVHDSRCPLNAYCIWPGVAIVPLTIVSGSDTISIQVATTVDGHSLPPEFVDTLGYRFELLHLSPYPDGNRPDVAAYVATIKVTTSPGLAYTPKVIITDAPRSYIEQKAYELDTVWIDGDALNLSVRYGGGCGKHYFQLYMSPGAFAESNPVQATLYLRHFGEEDFCMAYLKSDIQFDLGSIAELYHESYGGAGGEVRLNFINCSYDMNPPGECAAGWTGIYMVPDLLD